MLISDPGCILRILYIITQHWLNQRVWVEATDAAGLIWSKTGRLRTIHASNSCIRVITSVLLPPGHNKCTKSHLQMSKVALGIVVSPCPWPMLVCVAMGPPTNRSPPASGRMRLVPSTSVQVFRWSGWKDFKEEATPQSNNITEYNNWIKMDWTRSTRESVEIQ